MADLAIDCPAKQSSRVISYIDLIISCYFVLGYFVLEIGLRAFALRPKVFLDRRHWFNAIDLVIVVVTFAISVAYVVVVDKAASEGGIGDGEEHDGKKTGDDAEHYSRYDSFALEYARSAPECWGEEAAANLFTAMRVLVFLRFVRFIRLFRLLRLYTEHHMLKRAIRQTVSQVKKLV